MERGGAEGYPTEGRPGGPGYRVGDALRYRELMARWRRLKPDAQAIMLAYYGQLPTEPRVRAPGDSQRRGIGERLSPHCGELAGVVCVLAVTEAWAARRKRWGVMVKVREKALEDVRVVRGEAIPHMLHDLRELRRKIVHAMHGAMPGLHVAHRLGVVEATMRDLKPGGCADAEADYRQALVKLAEAQNLAQESVTSQDWSRLVNAVENGEKKLWAPLNREAAQKVRDAHKAWRETVDA